MKELTVQSVNVSEKKGTVKKPVDFINLTVTGIEGDAHSGPWNRMVSMLGIESVKRFEHKAGRAIQFGEFAENITTEGMELFQALPLDRFHFGEIVLELTQVGKSCHGDACAIYREVGNCVMPKEGIFCRVIKGGQLKAGDKGSYHPRIFKCKVITLSDRASRGEYEDKSGPLIVSQLENFFREKNRLSEITTELLPDDAEALESSLKNSVNDYDFIFTTGGTGIGPRDITPEVAGRFIDKEIPGIMEMIRVKYGMQKPNALLSRGVAGLSGNCFIFTLPGSVKGAGEYIQEITQSMTHLIYMRYSIDAH